MWFKNCRFSNLRGELSAVVYTAGSNFYLSNTDGTYTPVPKVGFGFGRELDGVDEEEEEAEIWDEDMDQQEDETDDTDPDIHQDFRREVSFHDKQHRKLRTSAYKIEGNTASKGAGVIYAENMSSIVLRGQNFDYNRGEFGGSVSLKDSSSLVTLDSIF